MPPADGQAEVIAAPATVQNSQPRVPGNSGPTNRGGRNMVAGPRRGPRPIVQVSPVQSRDGAPLAAAGGVDGSLPEPHGETPKAGCTLAQMRRFIKSRPYVPVHELRRRFLIEGIEDEVSPMPTGKSDLYVGLPPREAGFLGELVKAGEVGCELLLDPTSPAVIGVFPMRPVARQ